MLTAVFMSLYSKREWQYAWIRSIEVEAVDSDREINGTFWDIQSYTIVLFVLHMFRAQKCRNLIFWFCF